MYVTCRVQKINNILRKNTIFNEPPVHKLRSYKSIRPLWVFWTLFTCFLHASLKQILKYTASHPPIEYQLDKLCLQAERALFFVGVKRIWEGEGSWRGLLVEFCFVALFRCGSITLHDILPHSLTHHVKSDGHTCSMLIKHCMLFLT